MAYITDASRPNMGGNLPGGDPCTYCEDLWGWLTKEHRVQSVIDIGCGTGEALKAFRQLGCDTLGVEGLPKNVVECPPPVLMLDLGIDFVPLPNYDLVWCCEVVEHIEEVGAANLLRMMTTGRMLAMTHALPGQVGHHHVNCRPSEYWIERVEKCGMVFKPKLTQSARLMVPENNWFRKSGLVFTEARI